MKKSFLINIVLLIFLNLLIKPLWVFIEIEVQNKTGTEAFGLYFALFNLSMVLNMILDAGMVNFNNKKIAAKPHLASKYLNRLVPIRFILAGIYFLILLVAGFILQYSAHAVFILCTLGLNQVLLATLMFIRSNLQGMHFFKSDSIVSIADRVVMAALILYVFYAVSSDQFQIEWFVYIQTAGYLVSVLLALIFLFFHGGIKFKPRFNFKFSVLYLKRCFPYALIGVLMLFYSFIDSVILERIKGEAEAGIYAQSSRLLLALINFSYLFSIPLLPMFSRMIAKKEPFTELLRLSGSILILTTIFVSFTFAIYAEEIITALYAKKDSLGLIQKLILSYNGQLNNIENADEIAKSIDVFRICILTFIPMSSLYVYGTFLTAAGEMKVLNISAALAVLLNVCCNLLLIPYYGVEGAAVVSLITQTFVCTFQIYYMRKRFKLKLEKSLILRYISSLLTLGLTLWFFQQIDFPWISECISSVAISLLVAVLIKAIPIPSISKLLKFKEN